MKKDSEELPAIKHTHNASAYVPMYIHKHSLGEKARESLYASNEGIVYIRLQ